LDPSLASSVSTVALLLLVVGEDPDTTDPTTGDPTERLPALGERVDVEDAMEAFEAVEALEVVVAVVLHRLQLVVFFVVLPSGETWGTLPKRDERRERRAEGGTKREMKGEQRKRGRKDESC